MPSETTHVRWRLVKDSGERPSPRQGHSATEIPERGWIVVFGGISEAGTLNDLYILDVHTHEWTRKPAAGPTPLARCRHAAVYIPARDSIYVFGGFDGTKHMSDMYALSLSTWRWRPITYYSDVPSFSTYGACCSTSTTTITLVSGSHIGAGDRLSVFVFDLDTHKWAKGAATGKPPSARSYYTATVVSDKLTVFGGFSKSQRLNDVHTLIPPQSLARVQKLDPRSRAVVVGMWTAPPARHKPSGRFKHAACNVGDRLVVFGGRGVRGYSEGVHVLDTNAGVWTSLQPADSVCPCGREGHTASFVGGKVYVFAGWRGGQFYGDLYSFDHLDVVAAVGPSMPRGRGRASVSPTKQRARTSSNAGGGSAAAGVGGGTAADSRAAAVASGRRSSRRLSNRPGSQAGHHASSRSSLPHHADSDDDDTGPRGRTGVVLGSVSEISGSNGSIDVGAGHQAGSESGGSPPHAVVAASDRSSPELRRGRRPSTRTQPGHDIRRASSSVVGPADIHASPIVGRGRSRTRLRIQGSRSSLSKSPSPSPTRRRRPTPVDVGLLAGSTHTPIQVRRRSPSPAGLNNAFPARQPRMGRRANTPQSLRSDDTTSPNASPLNSPARGMENPVVLGDFGDSGQRWRPRNSRITELAAAGQDATPRSHRRQSSRSSSPALTESVLPVSARVRASSRNDTRHGWESDRAITADNNAADDSDRLSRGENAASDGSSEDGRATTLNVSVDAVGETLLAATKPLGSLRFGIPSGASSPASLPDLQNARPAGPGGRLATLRRAGQPRVASAGVRRHARRQLAHHEGSTAGDSGDGNGVASPPTPTSAPRHQHRPSRAHSRLRSDDEMSRPRTGVQDDSDGEDTYRDDTRRPTDRHQESLLDFGRGATFLTTSSDGSRQQGGRGVDSGDTTAEQGVEFGSGERALQEAAAHTAAVKDMADQIKRRREEQISRGKQSRELRATINESQEQYREHQLEERQATTEANRYKTRLETLKRLLALRDKSYDESELAVSEMSSSVDNINLRLTERESVRSQKRAVAQRLSAAVGDLEKQLQLSSSQHHETEELAREMQDDIAELKRVIPDRKRHKEELESETQKLRIKVAALQSKLHGLWTAKSQAQSEHEKLQSELAAAHKELRPDVHVENTYLMGDPGVGREAAAAPSAGNDAPWFSGDSSGGIGDGSATSRRSGGGASGGTGARRVFVDGQAQQRATGEGPVPWQS